MKKAKAPKVPVLEHALELNLPKLMKAAKAAGSGRLVVANGDVRAVVVQTDTRLAAFLGGRTWVVDIVAVPCLGGRLRPLLKCPRAHEGNFQSLYFRSGELACRLCHELRYRSTLAAGPVSRARVTRQKLLERMEARPGDAVPERQPGAWRKCYKRLADRFARLSGLHYADIRRWLDTADMRQV